MAVVKMLLLEIPKTCLYDNLFSLPNVQLQSGPIIKKSAQHRGCSYILWRAKQD